MQKESMEDLRERYGDYPIWAAIERARCIGYSAGLDDGYAVTANDPSAWYVEYNGEVFRLGDRVWKGDKQYSLVGWNFIGGHPARVQPKLSGYGSTEFHCITKIQPDSWEKLQGDIAASFEYALVATKSGKELADDIIARAKKLGGANE